MRPPDRDQRRQRPIPPRTTPLPPPPTAPEPHQEPGTGQILPPAALPVDVDALTRIGAAGELGQRLGDCARPIQLAGERLIVNADTGEIVDRLDTTGGHPIGVRCRNRRAALCPSCSALYRLDAFHLFAAGLRGGKNTPPQVADRPRLFVTLTAPSFGPIHIGTAAHGLPRRCHPRCGRWHTADDPAVGTALDPDRYDYVGQVLFNAHAGRLWARFTIEVRRHLAAAAGLSRAAADRQARIVFAKTVEFQTRGVVHVHAIVRLDGAHGPGSPPPSWASARGLEHAIRHAVRTVRVTVPGSRVAAARVLCWGRQTDIQHIDATRGVSDTAVAGYVAKYATKSTEATGITIAPLHCQTCSGTGGSVSPAGTFAGGLCRACGGTGRRRRVTLAGLSPHARALVETCWRLGGCPQHNRLRRWTHQLGFHGHFATKSRSYSTTFAALRAERRDWSTNAQIQHLGAAADTALVVVGDWRYAGRSGQLGRSA
jgi:hypothetical protein